MRPDRLVVGEVRDAEALDLLLALNTGCRAPRRSTRTPRGRPSRSSPRCPAAPAATSTRASCGPRSRHPSTSSPTASGMRRAAPRRRDRRADGRRRAGHPGAHRLPGRTGMTVVWGAVLAAGLLLAISPWVWPARGGRARSRDAGSSPGCSRGRAARMSRQASVAGSSLGSAVLAAAAPGSSCRWSPSSLVAAAAGAARAVRLLRARRSRLLRTRRALWPDVCDLLIASVRAGMSLPDCCGSSRRVGPSPLRPSSASFGRDLAASGHFDSSIASASSRRSPIPSADRIIETLRMARQVGGTELTPVLRALATSVRADAALRAEVESRQSWIRGAAVLGWRRPG